MEPSHRLAAIMVTDIVGCTAPMGVDQDAALKLLSKNRAIHKSIIERYNGDWLKEMGDETSRALTNRIDRIHFNEGMAADSLEMDLKQPYSY